MSDKHLVCLEVAWFRELLATPCLVQLVVCEVGRFSTPPSAGNVAKRLPVGGYTYVLRMGTYHGDSGSKFGFSLVCIEDRLILHPASL